MGFLRGRRLLQFPFGAADLDGAAGLRPGEDHLEHPALYDAGTGQNHCALGGGQVLELLLNDKLAAGLHKALVLRLQLGDVLLERGVEGGHLRVGVAVDLRGSVLGGLDNGCELAVLMLGAQAGVQSDGLVVADLIKFRCNEFLFAAGRQQEETGCGGQNQFYGSIHSCNASVFKIIDAGGGSPHRRWGPGAA